MPSDRIAKVSLAVAAALAVAVVGLVAYVVWLQVRGIRLEELTPRQRLALLNQADRVSPPVFREFLFSGTPGFYHMVPDTLYEGVYGATFTTNDLGFRAVPTYPKPAGLRRIVVAGDSWTFAPFVPLEAGFTVQLQAMLNREGERWQVYNLGMMGWNADNAESALETLLPRLQPDVVVICPTPNDADESFTIWDGRMVSGGFTTQAIFRDSYTSERRWIETFAGIQREAEWLDGQGVPTFTYFIANWRGMASYYAGLSGFTVPATVLPGAFVTDRLRLPARVDPGQHATAEGNGLIAAYLHNALIEVGIVDGLAPLPLDRDVRLLDHDYDPARVEEEFRWAREDAYRVHGADMMPIDPDYMLRHGIYSVPSPPSSRTVRVGLQLIDTPSLYPLTVEIRLGAPESIVERRTFDRYEPGVHAVTLEKPSSLDGYDFVDVLLDADRAALLPGRGVPVSMARPTIEIR